MFQKKYDEAGRRNSVPSCGSSPTSLTCSVRPKLVSSQTPVSECSVTRLRPRNVRTNYDVCVLCDKQCNKFQMHEWKLVLHFHNLTRVSVRLKKIDYAPRILLKMNFVCVFYISENNVKYLSNKELRIF